MLEPKNFQSSILVPNNRYDLKNNATANFSDQEFEGLENLKQIKKPTEYSDSGIINITYSDQLRMEGIRQFRSSSQSVGRSMSIGCRWQPSISKVATIGHKTIKASW